MRVLCLQFERFFAYLIFILPRREKKKKFSFFPSFSWKPFPSRWCVYAAKQASLPFCVLLVGSRPGSRDMGGSKRIQQRTLYHDHGQNLDIKINPAVSPRGSDFFSWVNFWPDSREGVCMLHAHISRLKSGRGPLPPLFSFAVPAGRRNNGHVCGAASPLSPFSPEKAKDYF